MPFVLINKTWQCFDILPTPASFSPALQTTTFLRLRVSLPYSFSIFLCTFAYLNNIRYHFCIFKDLLKLYKNSFNLVCIHHCISGVYLC